jgi:hypothetical protein
VSATGHRDGSARARRAPSAGHTRGRR